MSKILYYIYVGICSFRVHLPLTMVIASTATAPPSAHVSNLTVHRAYKNWLDDIYLNFHYPATNILSRFTESDNNMRRPDDYTYSKFFEPPSNVRNLPPGTLNLTNPPQYEINFADEMANVPCPTNHAPPPTWWTSFLIVMLTFLVCPSPPTPTRTPKNPRNLVCPSSYHTLAKHHILWPSLIVSSRNLPQPPTKFQKIFWNTQETQICTTIHVPCKHWNKKFTPSNTSHLDYPPPQPAHQTQSLSFTFTHPGNVIQQTFKTTKVPTMVRIHLVNPGHQVPLPVSDPRSTPSDGPPP